MVQGGLAGDFNSRRSPTLMLGVVFLALAGGVALLDANTRDDPTPVDALAGLPSYEPYSRDPYGYAPYGNDQYPTSFPSPSYSLDSYPGIDPGPEPSPTPTPAQTVTANTHGDLLVVREQPFPTARKIGTVPDGDVVIWDCSTSGSAVTNDSGATSTTWLRLPSSSGYVAAALVTSSDLFGSWEPTCPQ